MARSNMLLYLYLSLMDGFPRTRNNEEKKDSMCANYANEAGVNLSPVNGISKVNIF
jgi:hypothetical protein